MKQCLLDIKKLESKLDPGTGAKVMKRVGKRALKWPFTKKEVDEWVAKFQRLKETVNLALNADQISLIVNVDKNVIQLEQGQEAIKQERQLEKLPVATEASFDSYHRQYESECIADTRVELLQQLQDWGADHQRPIFWLSGMAGTGKSTIARTLANRFKSQKTLRGSFFFSRGSGEANNAVKFVGTLAYHLADTSPQLKKCICEAISSCSGITLQGLRNQWKELIIGPLSRTKFNQRPTLNFVIDALDECGSDDDIRLLLQLFVEVKDLNTIDLGVFVTSRPEIVIRLGFKSIPEIIHHNLDLRDIPRRTVEHDISVLLRQELGQISLHHELHDWPGEDNIRSLVQKADCLFIYAVTACRFIGDTDWDPEERLSEILRGDSADGGDTAQLDEMYMQVLRYSLTKDREEREIAKLCERFKQTVGPIVTLFDELSVSALAQLLSMPVRAVDVSLGTLHSVLNIPGDLESPVRLLHPSFHDFLLNETRCGDERFFVQEALMHGKLVTSCLGIISAALKRNLCHLPAPDSSLQDVQREMLNKQLLKHVQYACHYWVDHLANTRSDSRAQLGLRDNGEIHSFFQKDFLHWLEAMSLTGKMSQGVLMITKLANMVELVEHHALHAMVKDAERFILSNRAIIEKAPLQTYASALVFSPTGSMIRKCHSDQLPAWLVRRPAVEDRWDNCIQTLEGHKKRVRAIAFSPDGKYLASASDDTTVRLWDPATGALRSTLEGHDDSVTAVTFSRNGQLASASRDGSIRLWEPVIGVTSRIIEFHPVSMNNYEVHVLLSFLSNGDLVVAYDDELRIWNQGKSSFSKLLVPDFNICRLRGSSPQGILAVAAYRKDSHVAEVLLYDSTTGATQRLNTCGPYKPHTVSFSLDNKLALGFSDGTIELHDSATGSSRELEGHSDAVTAMSFSPDDKFLVSGSSDKTLRLWELSTQAQSLIGTCSSGVRSVAFSPDAKRIAAFCRYAFTVQVWEPSLGATINSGEDCSTSVSDIVFCPGGNQMACISRFVDNNIRLYDTVKEAVEFSLKGHSSGASLVTFSRDGRLLASASGDKAIYLWDPRTGTRSRTLSNNLAIVSALVFSSDGKQLASASDEGEVRIWNTETGYLRHKLKGHVETVSITFSLTGMKIAACHRDFSGDQSVTVWDTRTGELLHKLLHKFDRYLHHSRGLAFSPNERYLAYPSANSTLVIYNLETKESRNRLNADRDAVQDLAFSSDSKYLASSCWGTTIKLWDVGTARLTKTLPVDVDPGQLSFSADGTYLETERGQIQIGGFPEDSYNESSTLGNRWAIPRGDWMMQGNRKMLWLPPDFRGLIAHHDGLFGLACKSGRIKFLKVNQGEVVADVEG